MCIHMYHSGQFVFEFIIFFLYFVLFAVYLKYVFFHVRFAYRVDAQERRNRDVLLLSTGSQVTSLAAFQVSECCPWTKCSYVTPSRILYVHEQSISMIPYEYHVLQYIRLSILCIFKHILHEFRIMNTANIFSN